ncbi:MAG: abhydrolase domain-containing 18 [Acidobacteria bacterium]|nr:abhydrolase domain-containing 18 [Acidobacteriota bacterium]
MLEAWVHRWEHRRWRRDKNRKLLPFQWGMDFVGELDGGPPGSVLASWARGVLEDSEAFFDLPRCGDFRREGEDVIFPSAVRSPYPNNNLARCRYFPSPGSTRAVVVVPQWNADEEGHVALCRLLSRFGVAALRLCLPYHAQRRPPGMERADYLVSPNVGRTIQAVRQAVLDVRRGVDWLEQMGFTRTGILGTSIGSCIGFLAFAHDPRLSAGAFNHVSTYFADAVWTGITTRHVRDGLEGQVDLETLRRIWSVISPLPYVRRLRGQDKRTLLISARYDLTFLPEFSRRLMQEFDRHRIGYAARWMPSGHYTIGSAPFKYFLGLWLIPFFRKSL